MFNIAAIIGAMLLGAVISYLFFKKAEKNNALFVLLSEFKKTIDEYKLQQELNTKEIKEAIKGANELTKILTTNQNLKGQFGEDCLEQVLKAVYPIENIHYIKQIDTLNDENKKIKPDFLIKLPNNKNILIDCKLNLEKYIEYKETDDPKIKEHKKNEFIKDLNSTINGLSNKKYQSADLSQPDFILMYIPLEPVLTLIYTDKDLIGVIKNANDKNIIIVGTSSILTTLRLVNLIWAQQVQDDNVEKIVNLAQNIYELIALHSQNLYNIKKQLSDSMDNFNKEYEKISTGNKLFQSAQELREYGIQAAKRKVGKKLNELTIHDDFLK